MATIRPDESATAGALGVALAVTAAVFALTPATPAAKQDEPVLQRFLSRIDTPLTQYRAFRRMTARNDRFNLEGWIEVVTELSPEDGFRWHVVREGGSDYIRNRVLRAALQTEAKLSATDPSRSALSPANYDLQEVGEEEPGLVKLLARPKRRDLLLVDGAAFVTGEEADLVRLEGRLTKNPSFWTRDVRIVRRYDRVAGVRVPVRLDSNCNVLFVGRSEMTITYEYETVNGQPVGATVARNR